MPIKYPSLGTFGRNRKNVAPRRRIHRLIVEPKAPLRAVALTISVLLVIVASLFTPEHTQLRRIQAQNEGICGRTPEVRDVILLQVQKSRSTATCADVTSAELAAITIFDVSEPVTNVFLGYVHDYSNSTLLGSDFAGLTSLSELEISDSPMLKSIPANAFMGTPALTRLFFHTTGVETIHERAFAGLGNLQNLNLTRNPISALPPNLFRDSASLTDIDLLDNAIQFIPNGLFNNLNSLQILSMEGNRISAIEKDAFQGLSSLTQLRLTDNEISHLPNGVFEDLSSLTGLWLIRNELSTLPANIFSAATGLETLYLEENPNLQTIDVDAFNGLGALTKLRLTDSGLISLPEDVFEPLGDSLTDLRLNGNNLTSLPEDIFDGLTGLTNLSLQENELASLPEDVFDGLVALQGLYLHYNELTDLPADIFNPLDDSLRWLFLSNNKISTLHDNVFDGLLGLNWLILGGNSLDALPTDLFEPLDDSLEVLELHDNEIAMLHEDIFDGLTGLTELFLNGNQLAELHENIFGGMAFLEILNLGNNQLASLETDLFDPLNDSLQILRLEGNAIASLDQEIFDGLSGLQTLYLADNQLASLEPELFDPLDDDLARLALGSNGLIALPADIFDGLTGLTALDLSCNSITALDLTRFLPFAASLISLDVSGNPFNTQPTDAAIRAALTNLETLGLGANTGCWLPNDATLTSLSVQNAELVPSFDPAITKYFAEVPSSAQHATITFVVSDPLADFTLVTDGDASFEDADPASPGYQLGLTGYGVPGDLFAIDLTSEDRSATKQYDVRVSRKFPVGKETRLVELALKDVALDSKFDGDDEEYTAKVPADVTQVTVFAVPADPNATTEISLDDTPYLDGEVDLRLGWNDIYVNVTAEDGETTRSYRISVLRGTPQPRASSLQKILRIEPAISNVVLGPGDPVKLSVNIYGRQNLLDDELANGRTITWDHGQNGTIAGSGAEVEYSAPQAPGSYTVTATVDDADCFGDEDQCSATFKITVRRSSAAVEPTPAPVNPAGTIPTILTDPDGNQYEVFTPEGGGTFTGDASSLKADPGVVPNGEIVGLRIAEGGSASNEGKTYQRYNLGGNWYEISAVDASNNSVSSYGLSDAIDVCIPLPDQLRSNISDLAIVAINSDDSLTVLSSRVRVSAVAGTQVCGNLSSVPATIAAGTTGSPAPLPTEVPDAEDASGLPETGGTAPSDYGTLWALIVGLAIVVIGYGVLRAARRRNIQMR